MIFNQTIRKDLRDLFCAAVTKVFGDSEAFLDFLENEKYSTKYDCYLDYSGENYIINRQTGEYINWIILAGALLYQIFALIGILQNGLRSS